LFKRESIGLKGVLWGVSGRASMCDQDFLCGRCFSFSDTLASWAN
jgi:hypothetical protein